MNTRSKIRNICILGHIDHGKTTLADNLVASNGIISNRIAGQMRYMDDLPQEQNRGITMKSSSIALVRSTLGQDGDKHLINLIDSPGHVDFSSEVSTAVRLSDGAIVIIDAVEGVCPQTRAVLRQAWYERLKPILLINKIDRLITELKLTPKEAVNHLKDLIVQVNAVLGELFAATVMEESHKDRQCDDLSSGLSETDDDNLYFNPASGNVVFASAIDNWGFRPADFARMYAEKWSCKANVLEKTIWGDYYLQGKAKQVTRGAAAKGKRNLFEQLVLEPLWALYDAAIINRNKEKLEKITQSLEINIHHRDMIHRDGKVVLRAIANKWLPISDCTLDCVIAKIPSPDSLSNERIERLLSGTRGDFNSLPEEAKQLKQNFMKCCPDEIDDEGKQVPIIVYVAKMFVSKHLPDTGQQTNSSSTIMSADEAQSRREAAKKSNEARLEMYHQQKESEFSNGSSKENDLVDNENNPVEMEKQTVCLVAFARIFSGRIRPNQKLFVLHPKFDPAKVPADFEPNLETLPLGPISNLKHVSVVKIENVLQLMGRDFRVPTQGVSAGHVLGITGLSGIVLKSATLSSTLMCPAFTAQYESADPIVCVAIEPERPKDLARLEFGLKLLERADPCLQVSFDPNGETLVSAAGEVHLQKCLEDLRESFAPNVDFTVSPFRVPFRETLRGNTNIMPPKVETVVRLPHCSKLLRIQVRAIPITDDVIKCLEKYSSMLRSQSKISALVDKEKLCDFRTQLNSLLVKMRNKLKSGGRVNLAPIVNADNLLACGPERDGPNMLFSAISSLHEASDSVNSISGAHLEQLIIRGFRTATNAGPLCEEPVNRVAFVLEELSECENETDPAAPIQSANSGQVIAGITRACGRAMEETGARIMLAMYSMELMVRTEMLGRLHAVFGRRHGRITKEDLREGEDVFDVTAVLPVIDSFGLADDIRKKTSGHALQPQLCFSHWEIQDFDPNGEPGEDDDDEREDWFRTIRLINGVRRRKGLFVQEQLVEFGEKQRNLSKKR